MIWLQNGLFFPFKLSFLHILRNFLVNVILEFNLLDFIGFFSTDDEITYRTVMVVISFSDTQTHTHVSLNDLERSVLFKHHVAPWTSDVCLKVMPVAVIM